MTDRDTFAAAALTGLLAQGDDGSFSEESYVRAAYRWADVMLREREKTSVGVSATGAESGSTPDAQGFGRSKNSPCQPFDSAPTTDQERFVRFQSSVMNWISEATGFFHDDVLRTDDAMDVITDACSRCWDAFDRISYPTTIHDAAPAARADSTDERPPNAVSANGGTPGAASRSGSGTGDTLSRAEIDAIQHVVEDGRFVDLGDYGRLRSLLVRLRPEWEGFDRSQPVKDGDSDRPKPISDERLAALDELSALDQKLELEYGLTGNPLIKAQPRKAAKTDTTQPRNGTPANGSVPGECSFRDSRNANEPVAWLVAGAEYDTGCEYEYVSLVRESTEAAAKAGGTVTPLYASPPPLLTDEEREALEKACDVIDNKTCGDSTTLRKLLERMG